MASEGQDARAIAQALFVTPRSVELTLGNCACGSASRPTSNWPARWRRVAAC